MPFLATFLSPCPTKLVPGQTSAVVDLNISAFLENDLPDPSFNGQVQVKSSAPLFYKLIAVYDAAGNMIPNAIVMLQNGAFNGKAAIQPLVAGVPGGNFVDVALDATALDGSISGGGRPCRFIFSAPQPTPTDWVELSDKGQVLWSGIRRNPLNLKLRTRDKGLLFPNFTGGPQG